MCSLPCEECTKTNNHCCKADLPFDHYIAGFLFVKAKELGIDVLAHQHPVHRDKAVLVKKEWIENGSIDLETKDCIFFKDGKCSIYEDRPDICRLYGTKYIRCRWEAGKVNPLNIQKATREDIEYYDEIAKNESLIFKEIMK